jgi:hypothetical protein
MTMTITGIPQLQSRLKRLEIQIPKVTQEIMHETCVIGKEKAINVIKGNDAVVSGTLLRSLHFRVARNNANFWTDAGHAKYLEFGVKPHWVHGGMPSAGGGYTIWDWTNMKMDRPVWRFMADGKNTRGLHFMQQAYFEMTRQLPRIITRWEKML